MYEPEDIKRILKTIREFGLSAPEEMISSSEEELAATCNGIGCEHTEHISELSRKALNWIMKFAECSAAVHDWRYAHGDGTKTGRLIADKEFRSNMLDEISLRKNRFKWLREWLVLRAYEIVRKRGYSDWCIAFTEAKTKEQQWKK